MLREYPEVPTRFRGDQVREGAVSVVIRGKPAAGGARRRRAPEAAGGRPAGAYGRLPGPLLGDAGYPRAARDALWTELRRAGVDHLDTDDRHGLEIFLRGGYRP